MHTYIHVHVLKFLTLLVRSKPWSPWQGQRDFKTACPRQQSKLAAPISLTYFLSTVHYNTVDNVQQTDYKKADTEANAAFGTRLAVGNTESKCTLSRAQNIAGLRLKGHYVIELQSRGLSEREH